MSFLDNLSPWSRIVPWNYKPVIQNILVLFLLNCVFKSQISILKKWDFKKKWGIVALKKKWDFEFALLTGFMWENIVKKKAKKYIKFGLEDGENYIGKWPPDRLLF